MSDAHVSSSLFYLGKDEVGEEGAAVESAAVPLSFLREIDYLETYKRHGAVFKISKADSVYIEEHFVSDLTVYSIKVHFGSFCTFQLCYKNREGAAFQMIATDGDGDGTSWVVSDEDWEEIYARKCGIMAVCLRDPKEFFASEERKKKPRKNAIHSLSVGSCVCVRIFDKENAFSTDPNFEVVWRDSETKKVRFLLVDREVAIAFSEFIPVLALFKAQYPSDLSFFSCFDVEICRYE